MEIHETTEKIRVRAHQLWEEAGRPNGNDVEHWLRAEKELLLNSAAAAPLTDAAQTKTESSAPKAPKKSSGRSKSK